MKEIKNKYPLLNVALGTMVTILGLGLFIIASKNSSYHYQLISSGVFFIGVISTLIGAYLHVKTRDK